MRNNWKKFLIKMSLLPPNILFILADDLGVGDVSVYPSPLVNRSRLDTPNLDKLAMEGIRFDAAYAGYSVCAPSRMTLMTGRHVGHVHSIGMPKPASNATTVATMLKSAGYETFLLGKWGLDGNYKTPQPPTEGFPTKQGFDYFYGQSDQWQCHDYYPPQHRAEPAPTARPSAGRADASQTSAASCPSR